MQLLFMIQCSDMLISTLQFGDKPIIRVFQMYVKTTGIIGIDQAKFEK